ncbi:MAG: hypothetical protein F6K09_32835 [Merismopedia sp. SIO2A8]|nr:hypothetical protein [Merismopedia sp. SIO2A8]
MQTYHHKKIDLSSHYPCPCCRRGSLSPITLTEAFGCQQCQEIFVLHEEGYVLEGLKTAYPYPRKWYWTGYRWNAKSRSGQWLPFLPPLTQFMVVAGLFALLAILVGVVLPPFPLKWKGIFLGVLFVSSMVFWIMFQR